MNRREFISSIGAVALGAALLATAGARALGEPEYSGFGGVWVRAHPHSQWDPSRERALEQHAPLTAEYQAIFAANLAALRSGSVGADPQLSCLPSGMPRMMIAYEPMELIVTPETTYVRTDHLNEFRRIFTDGRDWPAEIKPSFEGYSIGKWIDQDGRYALEVETRGFKGPRLFDADGIPLHKDNLTVVKERLYLDRADRDVLHDEITTIDNALTRPWSVVRSYHRERNPSWVEYVCAEGNNYVHIGKEFYTRSTDGRLMPIRKDQPPPDLRYFKQ